VTSEKKEKEALCKNTGVSIEFCRCTGCMTRLEIDDFLTEDQTACRTATPRRNSPMSTPTIRTFAVTCCYSNGESYDENREWVLLQDYRDLERTIAELQRDARRYRWLRSDPRGVDISFYDGESRDWKNAAGSHLDEAIDAHIEADGVG
jgi:hypothetical protein